jgi:outer membrane protein assembly factor BamB
MRTPLFAFVSIVSIAAALVVPAETRRRIVRRDAPPAPVVEAKHYRGTAARTGVYGDSAPRNLAGQQWRVQTGGASFSSPVYANGVLYLADGTGREVALDAETGVTRWRSEFLSNILSTPVITNDAVYVGLDSHAVVALRLTDGSQLARFEVDSEAFASPLIDRNTLYIATESGAMYAFDLATRVQKWRFAGPGPAHGYPAAWNGFVFYAAGGTLLSLDASGVERWRFTGSAAFFSPSVAVAEGVVYGSSSNVVYAIDATTGSTRWTYAAPATANAFFSAPVVWSGIVVYGTSSPLGLLALNADIGTVVWQKSLPGLMEPVFTAGALFGGTTDLNQFASPNAPQKVYAFDILNGQELWNATVTGQVATGVAVGNDKVFVSTQARNVYAFH